MTKLNYKLVGRGDVADLFGGDFGTNGVNFDVDSDFSNPYLGDTGTSCCWFYMGTGVSFLMLST
jgi:hypothetical protein